MRSFRPLIPRPLRPCLAAVGLAVLLLPAACTSNQGADTETEDSLNTLTQAEQEKNCEPYGGKAEPEGTGN